MLDHESKHYININVPFTEYSTSALSAKCYFKQRFPTVQDVLYMKREGTISGIPTLFGQGRQQNINII